MGLEVELGVWLMIGILRLRVILRSVSKVEHFRQPVSTFREKIRRVVG